MAIGAVTAVGLVVALFADGWIDTVACLALAVPLLVILIKVNLRSRNLGVDSNSYSRTHHSPRERN